MSDVEVKEEVKLEGKAAEFADWLGTISLLEAADLVKALEEKFGVSAAAPAGMMMAAPAGGDAGEAAEEQTAFDVVLTAAGDKKIQVIKELRSLTELGLKEAKELVDAAPKAVKEGVTKDEAEEMKTKLEAVGASIEIK